MRWWLVFAALCVTVGDANAKRVTCSCPTRIVVPERGAQNVPTNAKIWVYDDPHDLERFDPELTPNAVYTDDALGTSFTVGNTADTTPPRTPKPQVELSVALHGGRATISLWGDYDPDTALIRVEIRGANGTQYLVTTPRRLYLCNTRFGVSPQGEIAISVWAIDLAGNQSAPYETTSKIQVVDGDLDTCGPGGTASHHHHHGHGFEILALLFLYVLFLVGWAIALVCRRVFGASREPAEEVSLLLAEALAARVLRWHVVWSTMLMVAVIGLLALDSRIVALCITPFAFVELVRVAIVRSAQRIIDAPAARAVRRGRWLVVSTRDRSVMVRASNADFAAAQRASIPRSVAR